jgi:hypothetical protein
MPVEVSSRADGIGSFHVHRRHAFDGFELRGSVLDALCSCGAVLDSAIAVLTMCDECAGSGRPCLRCGATGATIDHASLEWRVPATN